MTLPYLGCYCADCFAQWSANRNASGSGAEIVPVLTCACINYGIAYVDSIDARRSHWIIFC